MDLTPPIIPLGQLANGVILMVDCPKTSSLVAEMSRSSLSLAKDLEDSHAYAMSKLLVVGAT